MKTQFTSRIVKLTFAFMFILIASSCSEDNDAMDAAVLAKEINSEIAAKGGAKVSTAGAVASYIATPAPTGCDACVDEPVEQISSQTINWGSNNTKDITVTAWNDSDKFYIKVNSSSVNIDGVKISYPYAVNGGGQTTYNNEYTGLTGVEFTYAFDLQEDWQACDAQNYAVRVEGSGGAALFGQTTYNLFEICPLSCIESFSYAANEDGSYTFTYIPAEDMEDANVVFTFAQGSYVSGLEDWATPGVTMQKTMDLYVCTPISWTVVLESNCKNQGQGQGQTKANVFTDFKVNDVSRKGNVDKIEMPCTLE